MIATARSEHKKALARSLGADLVIDSNEEDVPAVLAANGIRLQCVIECVGSPATIAQAIDWAGKGAAVMLFGLTGPDAEITVKPDVIFKKELHITSSVINPYTYARAIELLRTGAVDVTTMIRNVIPLEELEGALASDTLRKQGMVLVKLS